MMVLLGFSEKFVGFSILLPVSIGVRKM